MQLQQKLTTLMINLQLRALHERNPATITPKEVPLKTPQPVSSEPDPLELTRECFFPLEGPEEYFVQNLHGLNDLELARDALLKERISCQFSLLQAKQADEQLDELNRIINADVAEGNMRKERISSKFQVLHATQSDAKINAGAMSLVCASSPMLLSVDRAPSLRTCVVQDYQKQAADLGGELEAWAWSEAHNAEAHDVALILWSLAAVTSKNTKGSKLSPELVHALTVRANSVATSFTASQMTMTWKALADLGATPAPAAICEMMQQVREIAGTFTPRHAKQTVKSTRKCGVGGGLVFASLKAVSPLLHSLQPT